MQITELLSYQSVFHLIWFTFIWKICKKGVSLKQSWMNSYRSTDAVNAFTTVTVKLKSWSQQQPTRWQQYQLIGMGSRSQFYLRMDKNWLKYQKHFFSMLHNFLFQFLPPCTAWFASHRVTAPIRYDNKEVKHDIMADSRWKLSKTSRYQ